MAGRPRRRARLKREARRNASAAQPFSVVEYRQVGKKFHLHGKTPFGTFMDAALAGHAAAKAAGMKSPVMDGEYSPSPDRVAITFYEGSDYGTDYPFIYEIEGPASAWPSVDERVRLMAFIHGGWFQAMKL